MPADHSLRTNDQEVPAPSARPHPSQPHPEDPIPSRQPWVRIAPKRDLELVTKYEIHKHDLPTGSKDGTDSAQEQAKEAEHGAAPYQPTLRRRISRSDRLLPPFTPFAPHIAWAERSTGHVSAIGEHSKDDPRRDRRRLALLKLPWLARSRRLNAHRGGYWPAPAPTLSVDGSQVQGVSTSRSLAMICSTECRGPGINHLHRS
jgi:hypothetical protein